MQAALIKTDFPSIPPILFTKIIGSKAPTFKAKCFWRVALIHATKTYVANPTALLSVGSEWPFAPTDF